MSTLAQTTSRLDAGAPFCQITLRACRSSIHAPGRSATHVSNAAHATTKFPASASSSCLKDGVPTGEYEDFMTGFVVNDSSVWARPVGVAVAHDGALLVSEDGNGTIWRVSYRGGP